MRILSTLAISSILAIAPAAAQSWEVGAGAGAGIYTSSTITAGSQSATVRFATAPTMSAYVGQNLYRKWAGELRYTWQPGQIRLDSGAQRATFAAQTHAVHYDVLYQFRTSEDSVRPFLAFGGGAKYFRGTGEEVVFQPLGQFAYLTRTAEWQPMLSVGGGIKVKINRRLMFRADVRDYLTPVPKKVVAPALGATAGGMMHDFVMLATLSVLF